MMNWRVGVLSLTVALCTGAARAQLTVNVQAGGDVASAAYQVLAAGGGTINLAAGTYNITQSIVLGPNTTLTGAGGPGSSTQTVIYAPQSPNGIAMVTQAYAGASNLTLSNLVLDGNIPQAAMLYGTGNGNYAYNDTGIYFYDQSATTVGVTLTNIEVRHTLRGILTGLVDNLTISGCYFHDNNPGGFSHNMYLVATSGVEIDHTRSDNALTGDGLHIDFGGYFYTIRKSEFSGNNGLGLLSQQDNSVTVEDTKIDFNTDDGIQIDAGGLVLTRDQMNFNGGYGFNIPDTADGNGQVNGVYTLGDGGTDYFYQASLNDFTIYGPPSNVYPAVQAAGVVGVADTGDWTLTYPGYTYMGAVDFNANHLSNGAVTFQVGNAAATGPYPLVIRYANGTSGTQTMNLSVNGGAAVPVSFPTTGSNSTWGTVTVSETLNVGNNVVTLTVPTGAASAPELDTLSVTTAVPSPPNAPTNLQATAAGPYQVNLSWTAPTSNGNAAQNYTIYRNGSLIGTAVVGTTYSDTRIFYGESTESYTVAANNQGGGGPQSNTATVTTGIDAPPGLQVSVSPGVPSNNLNWLGSNGAANYVVRRATVSGGPYATVATLPATTGFPTYSDTALAVGQNYYYVVAAVDASGNVSANSYQVVALSETFSLSPSSSSVNLSSATPDTISVVGTNGFSDAVTFTVSGLPAGVSAALSPTSGSSTQITFTANTSATQGVYPVTVTGTDGNLTASVGLTVVIPSGQLAQVITFNAIPQQAVGNTLAVYATASSGLPVTFSVVPNGNCSISGNVVSFLNGGACGVLAGQAGNASFSPAAQVGQVVQVGAPTAQTITFAAIGSQLTGTVVSLMATASSGLAVTFASNTPSVCTVSGSTASLSGSGTCTIVASQAGGGIYGAASVQQSFSVGALQTITFPPISAQPAGGTLMPSATASSGLTVTFTVGASGNCSISAGAVTFLHVGSCTIYANQPGNSVYASAAQASQVVTVVTGTPTIVFHVPDTHTINSPITLAPTSNSTGTFAFGVVSGPASDPAQTSTLMLTGGGQVTVLALQLGTTDFNPTSVTTTFNSIAGSVWLGSGNQSLSTFDLAGTLISPTGGFTGGGLGTIAGPQGMAFDSAGNLWVAHSTGISKFAMNGSAVTSNPFSGTGISNPAAVAVDGNSQVWVANSSGSVSVLSGAGAVLSTTSDSSISGATGVAIDNSGSVWISNGATNTVDEIIGAAAPTAPLGSAIQNGTVGVKP